MTKKRRGRPAQPKPNATKRQTRQASGRDVTPTPKRSRSRRPVVSPDDDVFIPAACSGVAPYTETLKTDDDDDAVYLPPPVMVQSDWVNDAGAMDRNEPSIWEPFQGIKPRAGSKVGWSSALLYAHGLEIVRNRSGYERVVCRYGCDGTTTNVAEVSHHNYKCAYWTREGQRETPF